MKNVQVINLPAAPEHDVMEIWDKYNALYPNDDVAIDFDLEDNSATVYVTRQQMRA